MKILSLSKEGIESVRTRIGNVCKKLTLDQKRALISQLQWELKRDIDRLTDISTVAVASIQESIDIDLLNL